MAPSPPACGRPRDDGGAASAPDPRVRHRPPNRCGIRCPSHFRRFDHRCRHGRPHPCRSAPTSHPPRLRSSCLRRGNARPAWTVANRCSGRQASQSSPDDCASPRPAGYEASVVTSRLVSLRRSRRLRSSRRRSRKLRSSRHRSSRRQSSRRQSSRRQPEVTGSSATARAAGWWPMRSRGAASDAQISRRPRPSDSDPASGWHRSRKELGPRRDPIRPSQPGR